MMQALTAPDVLVANQGDRFLSPLREECYSYGDYFLRTAGVYLSRLEFFIKDFTWRNNAYIKGIVKEIDGKADVDVLKEELSKRGISDIGPTLSENLLKRIQGCQATQNLYKRAEKSLQEHNGLPLVLRIVSAQTISHGAHCLYRKGEIWIRSGMEEDQALSTLLFELANMIHAKRFSEVHQKATKQEIDREQYARLMEEIEYDSTLLHSWTLKEAAAEQGNEWSKMDCFHAYTLDSNLYFETQKAAGHTDYFYQFWDRNYVQ